MRVVSNRRKSSLNFRLPSIAGDATFLAFVSPPGRLVYRDQRLFAIAVPDRPSVSKRLIAAEVSNCCRTECRMERARRQSIRYQAAEKADDDGNAVLQAARGRTTGRASVSLPSVLAALDVIVAADLEVLIWKDRSSSEFSRPALLRMAFV